MIDGVFFGIGALALLAAVIKAADARIAGRYPGQYQLVAVFIALGAACMLLSYSVQLTANRLYPQLGRLVSNLMVMVAACALLCLQLTLSYTAERARTKIRRRIIMLAAALATMTACFAAAAPLPDRLGDFGGLYRTRSVLVVYIAIYIAFLGTALGELTTLSSGYARIASHRRYLRAGLRMLAVGGVLGLIYLAEKIIYVAAQALNRPPPLGTDYHRTSPVTPAQCGFEITLPGVAILISVIGATLPVWGPLAASPLRARWRARTYRSLEPLWSALHREFPQIALTSGGDPPSSSPRCTPTPPALPPSAVTARRPTPPAPTCAATRPGSPTSRPP